MSERGRLISRGEAADICRLVHARSGDALNCVAWLEDGYSLASVAAALGEAGIPERTLPRRAGVEQLDPGALSGGEIARRERLAHDRQVARSTRYGHIVRDGPEPPPPPPAPVPPNFDDLDAPQSSKRR